MILSHKYKFIFLKTSKTAGTSVEIALSKFCGARDVITPITPADEEIRTRLGYRGPQNFTLLASKGFYNHISAHEVSGLVGPDVWNAYYKFCFERNPFERVISLYYFLYTSEPRPTITEFLDAGTHERLRHRGYRLYTVDDRIVVDRVCLYERINADLESLRTRLGLPGKIVLPWAKGTHRKDRRDYRAILSPSEQERIRQFFDKEITLFGY